TEHVCGFLSGLGYKEIIFQTPIQTRNYFQFLNTLAGKDNNAAKTEKLDTLFVEGDEKPITLVPMTSNIMALRLSDDVVIKRLAPLAVPDKAGDRFFDGHPDPATTPLCDFYTWMCVK